LLYEANSEKELPPIVIEVFDKDENLVGKDDEDFISRAVINLSKFEHSTNDTIPRPEWHKLYFKTGGAASGEALLSFAVTNDDYVFKKTLPNLHMENEVKMKEFGVSMNILGLRGL